jgi:putative ABC transport system ATP-binding protein
MTHDPTPPRFSPPPDPAGCDFVCLQNICKSYQEGEVRREVLVHASASFARGEFSAVLGKSGSGKSTLLNLISGIDRPDQGQVWVEGTNLTLLSEQQRTLFRRRSIGFIFQFFNLLPTLTILENVMLPAELNGVATSAARQRAAGLLEEVGLAGRGGAFPDRLSGGEQQRVAVARALVNDPLLLLADEPTGNLDEATSLSVLQIIDRLTRRAGKNLIMVTHSREAARFADRAFALREGSLLPLDSGENMI